jgi:hypothetical protein
MKTLLITLVALWLWLCGVQADQTIFQPTTYAFPASLTIQTGVPLAGTWDFTGATVTGLTVVGTGDVVGPASAGDNRVVFFDGTTGKRIKDSGLSLSGINTGDQTSVTGNAGTATLLQNARTINGVSFNGGANIIVPAAGSTLTDTVPFTKGGTGLIALGLPLQVLRTNSAATGMEWGTVGSGSGIGDFVGPGSSTDNAIIRFDGTTGKTGQNSGITIADGATGTLSGTNSGDQTFTLTGPVTGTGSGSIPTSITDGSVVLADLTNMATGSVFYRKTAGTGPPEVQPLSALKLDLGLTGTNSGDQINITGNAGTATILQTARLINGISFNGSANITIQVPVSTGITGLGTNVPALLATASPALNFNEFALNVNLGNLAFTDSLDFSAITGLVPPSQIDRTVDVVAQTAIVTVPADDPKKTTASGVLTTLAFTGTSGSPVTKEWRVDIDVTAPSTLSFTDGTNPLAVRRLGSAGSVTASLFTKGYHELSLRLIGTEFIMADSLPANDPVIWVAMSDEVTAITTGTNKLTCRAPYAFTVSAVRASLKVASISGIPTVDINEAGTSILSTKLTIDAAEKTSRTAAVPAVISDTAIADDAEMTFDIDVAGSGAVGLKVCVYGYR